ncbi:MAG: pyridoxal phosphate-dependent aminotransferase [Planctomycetota bacterium]
MVGPSPNARSRRIVESVTLAIAAKAARMKAEGKDVVSLGAGEPDFPTPEPIADAGSAAIRSGNYRYTATSGTPELRAAGARWLKDAFGLDYGPGEIMATAGAKAGLHMALSALVEPGDRVLVLAPYWVSYPALIAMAYGEPVILDPVPEAGFVHEPSAIARAAEEHSAKGLLLNYPNNPSGAAPGREHLQQVVDVASELGLWILSDEIYSTILYDGARHCSPAGLRGGRERTLVVNGFTKNLTLTGWRISFLAGPEPVIEAAGRIQSQVLGNPCTISQQACLEACRTPLPDEHRRRMESLDRRRRSLVERINALPGVRAALPQGAFYVLVDMREHCARLSTSDGRLAERLLEEHMLATVPGSAFGIPGFLRFSYAAEMSEIEKAADRFAEFVKRIA